MAKSSSKSAGNGGVKRGPNYSPEELVAYCTAYALVSPDGSVGCDQDGDTFWSKVLVEFIKLGFTQRTAEGLKKKWHGSKGVNATMSFMSNTVKRYRQTPRSGSSVANDIAQAKSLFKERFGSEINMDAWNIMRKLAKFSDDPETCDNFISSNLPKAVSRDKAKAMKREAKRRDHLKKAAATPSPLRKEFKPSLKPSPTYKNAGKLSNQAMRKQSETKALMNELKTLMKVEDKSKLESADTLAAMGTELSGLSKTLCSMEKTWSMNPSAYPAASQVGTRNALNARINALMLKMNDIRDNSRPSTSTNISSAASDLSPHFGTPFSPSPLPPVAFGFPQQPDVDLSQDKYKAQQPDVDLSQDNCRSLVQGRHMLGQ